MQRRIVPGMPQATVSDGYVFVATNLRAIARGHYFFAWSHEPLWRVKLRPGTFTITILRDPVRRALSYYRWLANREADADFPGGPSKVELSWVEGGFGSFLEQVNDELLLRQLFMFSQTFDPSEAATTIRGIHHWFFTEHHEEGQESLGRRLGVALPLRRDRRSVDRTVPTASELARLESRLAPEYELMAALRSDPGPGFVGGFPETF